MGNVMRKRGAHSRRRHRIAIAAQEVLHGANAGFGTACRAVGDGGLARHVHAAAALASAYGFLSIVDVDVNTINSVSEAKFKTQGPTALKYGTFSLVDANAGLWIYELDDTNAAVQALKTGQTLTETAQVLSFDNTAANVVITINGTMDGNEPTNTPPSIGGPVTAAAAEDSGVATVDLLTGASDLDGDPLQVVNLTGLVAGVTQSGNTLLVDTGNAAFQDLAAGAQRQIVVAYEVSDGKGGTAAQSATVTVTGINDPAVIGGTVIGTVSERLSKLDAD